MKNKIRKIIQIVPGEFDSITVLCDDGTIWKGSGLGDSTEWRNWSLIDTELVDTYEPLESEPPMDVEGLKAALKLKE